MGAQPFLVCTRGCLPCGEEGEKKEEGRGAILETLEHTRFPSRLCVWALRPRMLDSPSSNHQKRLSRGQETFYIHKKVARDAKARGKEDSRRGLAPRDACRFGVSSHSNLNRGMLLLQLALPLERHTLHALFVCVLADWICNASCLFASKAIVPVPRPRQAETSDMSQAKSPDSLSTRRSDVKARKGVRRGIYEVAQYFDRRKWLNYLRNGSQIAYFFHSYSTSRRFFPRFHSNHLLQIPFSFFYFLKKRRCIHTHTH